MAEGSQNPKTKIQALLDIRRLRGLSGQAAINEWIVTGIEVLLEAELARLEKKEIDAS